MKDRVELTLSVQEAEVVLGALKTSVTGTHQKMADQPDSVPDHFTLDRTKREQERAITEIKHALNSQG